MRLFLVKNIAYIHLMMNTTDLNGTSIPAAPAMRPDSSDSNRSNEMVLGFLVALVVIFGGFAPAYFFWYWLSGRKERYDEFNRRFKEGKKREAARRQEASMV